MGRDERGALIKEIQNKRNSKIITYITITDRPNVPHLIIADDAIRPIHRQLELIGSVEKIDLFLYTRGGVVPTAFRIVKLIREYCKEFSVLVPFRAHSAGTQIGLGADSIVMAKLGELSPVDPSTANLFNPILRPHPLGDPGDPRNRIPISVEDVTSYLDLAKEKVGLISESDRLEVFRILANKIEPLALGNVNRVYDEIRSVARQLLTLHMNPVTEEERIKKIVKALTEEYTHECIITRDLADEIGLKIIKPDQQEENLMAKLWEEYEKELKMSDPLDPEAILANSQQPVSFNLRLGFIESDSGGVIWITEGNVYPRPPNVPLTQPPPVRLKIGKWVDITQAAGPYV